MLEHIWHSFGFRGWENSQEKIGQSHQHVNIQITHKNVHFRPVHASHCLKVVALVHQPNQNALKLGYLKAWWGHVGSIMASAGDFWDGVMLWMASSMMVIRQAGVLSFMTLLLHKSGQIWKCAKQGGGASYFGFNFQLHRHCEKKWQLMKHLDCVHRNRLHTMRKTTFYFHASTSMCAEECLNSSFQPINR